MNMEDDGIFLSLTLLATLSLVVVYLLITVFLSGTDQSDTSAPAGEDWYSSQETITSSEDWLVRD